MLAPKYPGADVERHPALGWEAQQAAPCCHHAPSACVPACPACHAYTGSSVDLRHHASQEKWSFPNLKKNKKLNKLVLKYAPWLGSLYCCFFLISFSLPAPKSYLPEREAPLFFPSSLWMSVLKWLKCLHCVQFWHRCSAFFF